MGLAVSVLVFAGREYHGYEPKWFAKQNDPLTGNLIHMFTHEYWQCKQKNDWSRCPDIFVEWPASHQIIGLVVPAADAAADVG